MDCFHKVNITPLFYVETVADLYKEMRKGRTPEQVVGIIADETPDLGIELNVPQPFSDSFRKFSRVAEECVRVGWKYLTRPIDFGWRGALRGGNRTHGNIRPPRVGAVPSKPPYLLR